MSENCSDVLKSLMRSDFAFFKRWYDFHFNIEKYVARERYASLINKYSEKVFDAMILCPSSRKKMKRLILQECGFSEDVDYDIASNALPFAMLSQETMARAITIVGTLVCFKDMAKVVSKKELEEIFAFVGKDVYTFVIKRSLLFWKKIPNLTEDYSEFRPEQRIQMYGKLIFEYIISSLPKSVVERLKIRSKIEFNYIDCGHENNALKAMDLVKYALNNFLNDSEDVKLCLK